MSAAEDALSKVRHNAAANLDEALVNIEEVIEYAWNRLTLQERALIVRCRDDLEGMAGWLRMPTLADTSEAEGGQP